MEFVVRCHLSFHDTAATSAMTLLYASVLLRRSLSAQSVCSVLGEQGGDLISSSGSWFCVGTGAGVQPLHGYHQPQQRPAEERQRTAQN